MAMGKGKTSPTQRVQQLDNSHAVDVLDALLVVWEQQRPASCLSAWRDAEPISILKVPRLRKSSLRVY